MARVDRLATVLHFLNGLQPKIGAQIAKQVLALNVDPLLADSEQLSGYQGFYRVYSGEYLIVYRFFSEQDLLEVILLGRRNDDDTYKRLKRLLG
ncbi:type II toxin-antitoxin system RelE family toxin [Trichormus azollae]|uniref:type II toxin-antitoxin system RelE family toxin n=1 Tax=Trichormus azollae TaxID=1164 RepID=UPI00325C93D6